MLNRIGLLSIILGLGMTSQAQTYGHLQNGLTNPQQEQIDVVASGLEQGLGRKISAEELNEITSAISKINQNSPDLVRVSKRDLTRTDILVCLWSNISPITISAAMGTCSDFKGNSYIIYVVGRGLAFGFAGRVTAILYEGIESLPVEGTYTDGVTIEGAFWGAGAHAGMFSNKLGSQRISFIGWSGALWIAAGITGTSDSLNTVSFEIQKISK